MMGKISNKSAIEIIPISVAKAVQRRASLYSTSIDQGAKMQRLPYLSDPQLVPRVQKYLESNVDKTYVDINLMADELQRKYREYSKRKRSAFRASVKRAYAIVLQSYGLDEQGGSTTEEDDVSDESEPLGGNNRFHDNSMNNQLLDLYTRPNLPKQIEDNELIDISSDDSEGNQESHGEKSSNGPSTSNKAREEHVPTLDYAKYVAKLSAAERKGEKYSSQNSERGKKRKHDNNVTPPFAPNKKKKSVATLQEPICSFKDIGGLDNVLIDVCKLLNHIQHPEMYRQIGVAPPRGFLLHGPPGCGKTLLANAIAGELGVVLLKVAAPELVAGVSGESEERIRELFDRALCSAPCVLFIDEIDAITPNRQNAQKEMERRIVAQLLSCLDDLNQNVNADKVLVIGATNRPDSIDPALRRAGRFDREISLGIPNEKSRLEILKTLTAKLKLSGDFDYVTVAKYTPGFVGADLMSLVREAAMIAVNRLFKKIQDDHKVEQESAFKKQIEENKIDVVTVDNTSNDANKSDLEIIVDDDVKEPAHEIGIELKKSSESPVLIIDDDGKGSTESIPPKSPEKIVNGAMSDQIDILSEVTSPILSKPLTPLEEVLSLLHDKTPLKQNQLSSLKITLEDFIEATKHVQPSAKREGFATVPDVTWDDVGSLRDIREELQMAILAPIRHSEQFKSLGLNVPAGVLLCGPPGCGKTLLAKAIANEAGVNFISVKGPELLNMYVGESERAVRICFERARNSAPCVIFFDEVDALCPKRSDSRESGPTMRVVNQMLTEMDGVEGRNGVYLLAATNRPDIVDPAVLRPGRMDKILYVGLPSPSDRADILKTITKNGSKPLLAPDVDLEVIGASEQCQGYTGADLAALVREAATFALREVMMTGNLLQTITISRDHFQQAIAKIRPSVTEKDQKHYEKLRKVYTAAPQKTDVEEMELS